MSSNYRAKKNRRKIKKFVAVKLLRITVSSKN